MDTKCKLLFLQLVYICTVSVTTSYDIGQTYNYRYVTTVSANQPEAPSWSKQVTFQLEADVAATNVWQNAANSDDFLLLLQVSTAELLLVPKGGGDVGEMKTHQSTLDNYRDKSMVVHLVDGVIVELYVDNEQSEFVNIQAGIASLFQLHLKTTERNETDSSGYCRVAYKFSGNTVHKKKSDCQSPFKYHSRSHPSPILRATSQNEINSKYELKRDNIIESVESIETQTYEAVILKTVGSFIESRQKLNLVGEVDGAKLVIRKVSVKEAIKGLSRVVGSALKKTDFHVKSDDTRNSVQQCKTFLDILTKRQNAFQQKNLAKFSSVATFLNVLQYAKECSKESIIKVLRDAKNKAILPQLLDVLAATGTVGSIEAAMEFLKLDSASKSIDLPERFLSSLATAPFPQQNTIDSLMVLLGQKTKSQKLFETLLLTVGSLAKNYQRVAGQNDETVERVLKYFVDNIKDCKDHLCKLPYLRGLQQAELDGSLPVLLDVIREGGKAVSQAILSLRALPKSYWTDEVKTALQQVYFQLRTKQDPSARVLAAESLLSVDPSVELLADIVRTFNKTVTHEMATYILSKIRDIASRDSTFRQKWLTVLQDPSLRNYHILAQSGFSVAEVHLVPEIPYVNASYEVKAEFLRAGVFKRSIFDTTCRVNEDTFHLLTFGTFAGGLASLSGSGTSGDDEEEEMTAGLDLNVMGVGVRPYTLFTGQGEVMGLLWSGAGSETTPIFQANMKLHDNRHVLSLQNGLKVEKSLLGATSIDLSGSVQVSLWSRNSQSQVTNSFALLIKSSSRIETSFIDIKVEVTTATDLALEFITDSDFSDTPLKSCMLFQHNPFLIKQLVTKLEKVPGSARKLRRSSRQRYNVPGRCFALNRRVIEMCSQMKAK